MIYIFFCSGKLVTALKLIGCDLWLDLYVFLLVGNLFSMIESSFQFTI